MKAKKREFVSLRIELDLSDALEARIADMWREGIDVAVGVNASGKQLFRHAMAKLLAEQSGKREVIIDKEERKIEGVSGKEKNLGDWVG